jgi:hypothetical protein
MKIKHTDQRKIANTGFKGIAALGILTLIACSQGQTTDDGTEDTATTSGASTSGASRSKSSSQGDQPMDSTGAFATLNLGFTTSGSSSSLSLTENASLDIGNGITLSDARINIKMIKLKASRERSSEESKLKEQLKSERKKHEQENESEKKAIEEQKDAIAEKYAPLFQAAESDSDKETLRDQMKAEEESIEEQKALLEKAKDEAEDQFEADNDQSTKWQGPYVYDIVHGTVSPELPTAVLLDGSYRRIEFKVKPNREADSTDPLLNKSIYIAGAAVINSVATPFAVALDINEEFRLFGSGGVKLDSTNENSMAVAFDPAIWFTNIDFSSAQLGIDGMIHIDSEENASLSRDIRHNMVKSTRFGKDSDGDGKLAEGESEGDGADGLAEDLIDEEEAADSQSAVSTQEPTVK